MPRTERMHTTAYCGCQRCCGWHYGAACPLLPLYFPLTLGAVRASGTRTLPLFPRRRRHSKEATARERAVGAALGAAVGATVAVAALALARPIVPEGGLSSLRPGAVKRQRQRQGQRRDGTTLVGRLLRGHGATGGQRPRSWSEAAELCSQAATKGSIVGGGIGAAFPVRRYWAETSLAGRPYAGTTSTNVAPRPPRPPLLSLRALSNPLGATCRLLTFRWRARDGTIAADTAHLPFGTRLRVPGWGDGVVEDRGGAITGAGRLDLFHGSHAAATRYGRRDARVVVLGRTKLRQA